jgi:hypothetical protein
MNVLLPPAISSIARLNGLSPKTEIGGETGRNSNVDLIQQLEGPWSGFASLSEPRKLALSQATTIILGMQRNVMLEYTLGMKPLVPEAVEIADESASRHAHVATVTLDMIRKMKEARGIVASSEFAWMRKLDIAFWRLVNGFGRKNHVAACVGAFAHYEIERSLKRSIPKADFSHLVECHPSLASSAV